MSSEASNDAVFRSTLSRACPLRATFCRIQGQPSTLILYKIQASRYWQCRFAFSGKMIARSTRTVILDDAKAYATRLYDHYVGASVSNGTTSDESSSALLFRELAIKLMRREAARRDRGELAHLSYKADEIRLATEIIPYFGAFPIQAIVTLRPAVRLYEHLRRQHFHRRSSVTGQREHVDTGSVKQSQRYRSVAKRIKGSWMPVRPIS